MTALSFPAVDGTSDVLSIYVKFYLIKSVLFCRGSQLATRQAYNYIDALIKDPERDVSEILPARSKKTESLSSSASIHNQKQSSSINASISSSIKNTSSHYTQAQSSPPSLSHLPPPKHPTTVSVTTPPKPTSRATSQAGHRLPPRMAANNTISTTATTTQNSKPETAGWGACATATATATASHNVPSQRVVTSSSQGVETKPFPVSSVIVTKQLVSSAPSSKSLPKPIGSNRPAKFSIAKETTQTTQSTKTTPSLSAQHVTKAHVTTSHSIPQPSSALNSFFSQVATQVRSPMIWNDPDLSNDVNDIVITTGISQSSVSITVKSQSSKFTHATVVTQNLVSTTAIVQATSPTPSLSPTPSNSASPSPGSTGEERPHLNPIGTERAHKRCSSQNLHNIPRMSAFQQGI